MVTSVFSGQFRTPPSKFLERRTSVAFWNTTSSRVRTRLIYSEPFLRWGTIIPFQNSLNLKYWEKSELAPELWLWLLFCLLEQFEIEYRMAGFMIYENFNNLAVSNYRPNQIGYNLIQVFGFPLSFLVHWFCHGGNFASNVETCPLNLRSAHLQRQQNSERRNLNGRS